MAQDSACSTSASTVRRFGCRRRRATRRALSSTSARSTICSTASTSKPGRARPRACGRTEKSARRGSTDRARVVTNASAMDATTAEARIAALEAALTAERAALAAERARVTELVEERDILRASHERLRLELELLRRRIFIAKAERVDTTQLELEFAGTLAALDRLGGLPAPGFAAGDVP